MTARLPAMHPVSSSMNIREHIEAGHYPRNEAGYAVVRTRSAREAWIIVTDYRNPEFPDWPILGFMPHRRCMDTACWTASGGYHGDLTPSSGGSPLDLLPPPPRKVKVTRYLLRWPDGSEVNKSNREHLEAFVPGFKVIELTGEYEEPWS